MPQEIDLRPCPFCGERLDLDMMKDCKEEDTPFYVQCRTCTTTGPDGADFECAQIQWNTRDGDPEDDLAA